MFSFGWVFIHDNDEYASGRLSIISFFVISHQPGKCVFNVFKRYGDKSM
jgi:hypothetical protein